MTNASASVCPFAVGGKITDRKSFIGRRDEIELIISHMQSDRASLSIVGDRRIGKSSLIYHIAQTYEDRVINVDQFVVIYLSLQQANCRNRESFYQAIAAELLKLPKVQVRHELADPLRVLPSDEITFESILQAWQAAKVLPVVCLDDFEELLDRTDSFDKNFYDYLRSLITSQKLMLVIASRKPLIVYSRQKKLTSDFFNVFTNKRLTEFKDDEAKDLVRLPHADHPALGEEKRTLALQWGDHHPCLLQIAAWCLWEAKKLDHSHEWAKRQFEERKLGIPRRQSPLKWTLQSVIRLGGFGQAIGDNIDDWGNFVKGMFILLLIVAMGTGAANWQQVKGWFDNTAQEIKQNFK